MKKSINPSVFSTSVELSDDKKIITLEVKLGAYDEPYIKVESKQLNVNTDKMDKQSFVIWDHELLDFVRAFEECRKFLKNNNAQDSSSR